MQSVLRHTWYLAPDTVVFAMFDANTSNAEKEGIARAILQTPRPARIPLGKPRMPDQIGGNPRLATFVGSASWKIFDLLGVGYAWLQQRAHLWPANNDYNTAKDFVHGLTVVNDGAECCIRSITDFAAATRDSIYREDILLVGNSHREVFQDLRKAALARINR